VQARRLVCRRSIEFHQGYPVIGQRRRLGGVWTPRWDVLRGSSMSMVAAIHPTARGLQQHVLRDLAIIPPMARPRFVFLRAMLYASVATFTGSVSPTRPGDGSAFPCQSMVGVFRPAPKGGSSQGAAMDFSVFRASSRSVAAHALRLRSGRMCYPARVAKSL
jgi:hypothetical protein